jgi:hypothetical protein
MSAASQQNAASSRATAIVTTLGCLARWPCRCCQRRLHGRWQHLHGQRAKHPNVVTIAVARELAAFCWEAALID